MDMRRGRRSARCLPGRAWRRWKPCATWRTVIASPWAFGRGPRERSAHDRLLNCAVCSHGREASMRTLYPQVEPYDTYMLPVDGRHTRDYEQSENPKGKQEVRLQGGAGGD